MSINTVLQRNQSCTNPEVVPCTSEAEEWVDQLRKEMKKSGSAGQSQSQLCEQGSCAMHPISCVGGATPPVGCFADCAVELHCDTGHACAFWKTEQCKMPGVCVPSVQESWPTFQGLNSKSQFAMLSGRARGHFSEKMSLLTVLGRNRNISPEHRRTSFNIGTD